MGKIISVWSLMHQTGKTLFLYNLLNRLAEKLEDNLRILVCCTNLSHGNLMGLFNIEKGELNLEDMVNFKITSGGNINIFEALARLNNVYFCGSRKTDSAYAARNIKAYEELLRDFKGKFDLILVDTMAGRDNPLSNLILRKSDYVINILSQDKECLDTGAFRTEEDFIYIVNRYRDIYPRLKDISSNYKLNKPVYIMPYCEHLQEMKNKGKLSLYVQHDTDYNRNMQEVAALITGKLKLGLKEDNQSSVKKRGRFKNTILNLLGEAYE